MKVFKQRWQNNCWTAEVCCNINFMDYSSAAAGEVINQLLYLNEYNRSVVVCALRLTRLSLLRI